MTSQLPHPCFPYSSTDARPHADHPPTPESALAPNNNLHSDEPPWLSFEDKPQGYRLFPTGENAVSRWDVQGGARVSARAERHRRRESHGRCSLRVMSLVVVLIVIGASLAFGFGLGLKEKDTTRSTHLLARGSPAADLQSSAVSQSIATVPSPTQSSPGPESSTMARLASNPQAFPLGEWKDINFLSHVTSHCHTYNVFAWECFPYTTYDESATASATYFSWNISSTDGSAAAAAISYTISMAASMVIPATSYDTIPPFEATLILEDVGTSEERYTFSIPRTITQVQVPWNGQSSPTCFYHDVKLRASFYTKKAKKYSTYNSSLTLNATTAGTTYMSATAQEWPYAVQMKQVVQGGPNNPVCVKMSTEEILSPIGVKGRCACVWKNYGL